MTLDSLMQGNWVAFGSSLRHLVLPALTIAAYPFGLMVRMVRASLLDVIALDHVRLLRALGQRRYTIAFRYALRNAWPATLTVLSLTFAYSLTGTFLVESVFNWPGLGNYTAQAVVTNDYPAVMGVTLCIGVIYVVLNLVVDLVIASIDPRVRYV
jgi:peptide/nickel transport system permease protein